MAAAAEKRAAAEASATAASSSSSASTSASSSMPADSSENTGKKVTAICQMFSNESMEQNEHKWLDVQSKLYNHFCHSCILRYASTLYTYIAVEGEAPADGTVVTKGSAENGVEGSETIQVEGTGETEAEAEGEVEGVVEDPMAAEMNEEVEEKIENSAPSARKDLLEQVETDSEVNISSFIT